MKKARINGIELEYDVTGAGEPLLLIDPILVGGSLPLLQHREIADRYRVITYHRRGWGGSTKAPGSVTIAKHADDAAALLDHLDISRAHVVGHSSSAAIALQLALDHPARVHSLALLELTLLSVPAAQGFFAAATPALEAHAAGRGAEASKLFLSAASGLDWEHCRALLEQRVPGLVERTIRDADTCFGVEFPALMEWRFDRAMAQAIDQPVLTVLGADTGPLWIEVDELLRTSLPKVESCTIEGAGHLLHMHRPEEVGRHLAGFLERHPLRAA